MAESSIDPNLTVVMPTFQRAALLERSLGALRRQNVDPRHFEVVVIDDGSRDGTSRLLAELSDGWPNLRWEAQTTNRGPAAARNRGIDMARAPLILFLDDDIEAPPSLLGRHLVHHQSAAGRLAVVGRVDWHPDLPVTDFMRWLDQTDLQFAFGTWMREGPVEQPWKAMYTCNLSLGRGLLLEAGGFDERFQYAAYEDVELGIRLASLGLRLDFQPDAFAWHLRAPSLDEFCRRMTRVGESVPLFNRLQQSMHIGVDLTPERRGSAAKRRLAGAWPLRSSSRVRSRYYSSEIHWAYQRGLRSALARGEATSSDPAG